MPMKLQNNYVCFAQLLPNSLGRKRDDRIVIHCDKEFNGVATHLTIFDKALFRDRRVHQLELLLPTMGAGKIMLDHKIKVTAIVVYLT